MAEPYLVIYMYITMATASTNIHFSGGGEEIHGIVYVDACTCMVITINHLNDKLTFNVYHS